MKQKITRRVSIVLTPNLSVGSRLRCTLRPLGKPIPRILFVATITALSLDSASAQLPSSARLFAQNCMEFGSVHEIDCRNPNELYVGEITNWRVQKLTLR